MLKIAGDNDNTYGRSLKKQVEELNLIDRIKFIGQIEAHEKQVFLAGSYFNFMPSHTENFGLVVVESLAQGTPVVATIESPWSGFEVGKSYMVKMI